MKNLIILSALLVSTAALSANPVVPHGTQSYAVTTQNELPRYVQPMVAQDLSIARSDPTNDFSVYKAAVFQQWTSKHGRTPTGDFEIAQAVVDWIASNLRHPAFWPEDPSLPRFYAQYTGDPMYATLADEPLRILNYTMSHDPNNAKTWPSPLCTYQNEAAAGILNYLGLHARLVDVEGHTGLEYFSPTFHKWIWMDSTFNEHYLQTLSNGTTVPLGVRELNALTLAGQLSTVSAVKHGVPSAKFPVNTYIIAHPHGFREYAVTTNMNLFAGAGKNRQRWDTFVFSPEPPATYVRLPGEVIHFDQQASSNGFYYWPIVDSSRLLDYPLDSIAIATPPVANGANGLTVKIISFLPYTTSFDVSRTVSGGAWTQQQQISQPSNLPATSQEIRLDWGSGTWQLRGRDAVGNTTQVLRIDMY
ncbi:hypothetical protein [Collimonas sp.]|uniref:hypothetical protein n=1 Tax=Collimonas sp. TaxID=1963772 RepID=UPI002B7BB34B|nr:hypothetical protein [Collimonas sp.]HWX03207.1 hypothetical protein [Collimonas sp.]